MAHNVFECEWIDRAGNECILLIVDTDMESSDMSIMQLTPGANPFVTSTNTEEDIFCPTLETSAVISFISNFELVDEFNFTRENRYRVFLQVGGTIRWRGLLTTEALSQPYKTDNDEFVLNAIGDLKIPDLVMLDTTTVRKALPAMLFDTWNEISAWDVSEVWTAFDSRLSGIRPIKFYFPSSDSDILLDEALTALYPIVPYVGQEDPDENIPVSDWLKQVCQLLGWTMVQIDSDIYFTSPYATSYTCYDYAYLYYLNNPTTTSVSEVSTLTPVDDHSITVVHGFRNITINATKTAVEGNLFDDIDDMVGDYGDSIEQTYAASSTVTRNLFGYLMDNDSSKLSLKTILFYRDSLYTSGGSTVFPSVYETTYEETDITQDALDDREMSTDPVYSGFASAHLASVDIWEEDSTSSTTKRRYNFTKGILVHQRLPLSSDGITVGTSGVQPGGSDGTVYENPIAVITSRRPIDVVAGGCLTFNIQYKLLTPRSSNWYFNEGLPFMVKGTLLLEDGTSTEVHWLDGWWVSETDWEENPPSVNGFFSNQIPCWARVPLTLRADNAYLSATFDTQLLTPPNSMPYNDSEEGYIMPLTEFELGRRISGYLTLEIYPCYDCTSVADTWYLIHDISLVYSPEDRTTFEEYEDSKTWTASNSGNSEDLDEIDLKMHSEIDSEFDYGTVTDSTGANITTMTLGDGSTTVVPEEQLLAKYSEAYGEARHYYDLACQYDENVSPLGATYGSKRFLAQKEVDWLTNKAIYYYYD